MNKKSLVTSLRMTLLAASVFSAAYANAESPIEPQIQVAEEDYFDVADTNKDNSVSMQEFAAFREAQMLMSIEQTFTIMDKDHNGLLTLEEHQAFFPGVTNSAKLHAAAAGEDGVATLEEFVAWRLSIAPTTPDYEWAFALFDKDHDGALSHAEFTPGYVQPAVEPKIKPEVKPELKPAVEPKIKPEVKPAIESNSQQVKKLAKLKQRMADMEAQLAEMTKQMADLKTKLAAATKPAEQKKLNQQIKNLQTKIDAANTAYARLQKMLSAS